MSILLLSSVPSFFREHRDEEAAVVIGTTANRRRTSDSCVTAARLRYFPPHKATRTDRQRQHSACVRLRGVIRVSGSLNTTFHPTCQLFRSREESCFSLFCRGVLPLSMSPNPSFYTQLVLVFQRWYILHHPVFVNEQTKL